MITISKTVRQKCHTEVDFSPIIQSLGRKSDRFSTESEYATSRTFTSSEKEKVLPKKLLRFVQF